MVVIITPYDKINFKIGGEKRSIIDGKKRPSIVEPGRALPMNKLIKGVINGSIVINSVAPAYDFNEHDVDIDDKDLTKENVSSKVHDAFVDELQKQSSDYSDPTVAPGFNVNDAEQIEEELNATLSEVVAEGGRESVVDGSPTQKAGAGDGNDSERFPLNDVDEVVEANS